MTIPSMSAIGGRIAQIQGQLNHVPRAHVPKATTRFADVLAHAEDTATVAPVLASPSTSMPTGNVIGILGTPVIVAGHAPTPLDGNWPTLLPAHGQEWAAEIEDAASKAGLDPRLLAAMVWQESGFAPDAVSRSGAIGLAQLMPGTAAGLEVDPWDPVANLEGGARYLAWTIEEFGSIELGLAAYNAGPGRVREANGIPNITETQAYVPRVLDYYRQLGGMA